MDDYRGLGYNTRIVIDFRSVYLLDVYGLCGDAG